MDNYSSLSDEQIAEKIQNGENDLIGELISRYEEKMKGYARKFLLNQSDISDVVQEIFIKVYRNIQSFDLKKRFSPWIYRIAHNEFINLIKKNKREPWPFFDADTLFPHPIAKERAENKVEKKEIKELIDKFLKNLKPKYREPLILYYFEDLSYREIADALKIPVSTVGIRIKRAKENIKKLYKNYE